MLILFRIWQVDQFEAEAKALEEKVDPLALLTEQCEKSSVMLSLDPVSHLAGRPV
jgi:hypothetical protein